MESAPNESLSAENVSRREFIKVVAGMVSGLIGLTVGIPAVAYLLGPALKSRATASWIPIGRLADMPIGEPYAFEFTRVQVNGWERTSTAHGGFVLRRSAATNDLVILNSRCTHLACSVNWKPEAQAFVCPCHDGKFGKDGAVLSGPPPRALDQYTDFRLTPDGTLEVHYEEG
jgi:Rieske Fe-S protein